MARDFIKKVSLLASIFLVLVFLFIVNSVALADRPMRPYSYKKIIPGTKYIFVMFGDEDYRSTHTAPPKDFEVGEDLAKYHSSGLYANDNTSVPLWSVSWYAFPSDVFLSSDGKYVARMGPWALLMDRGPDLTELAVAFYENGNLLKRYSVIELLSKKPELTNGVQYDIISASVSHYTWKKSVFFDKSKEYLHILTLEGIEYIFDIKTGEIIAKEVLKLEDDCEKLKRQVLALLSEKNYCNTSADCEMVSFDCPFGCYRLVNKNVDLALVREGVAKYRTRCPPCLYDCGFPKKEEIKCSPDHRCIGGPFAK